MENRGFWYYCIPNVFKNILSTLQVSEMGIPLCKTQGFPKLSHATSQIENSLSKTSILTAE